MHLLHSHITFNHLSVHSTEYHVYLCISFSLRFSFSFFAPFIVWLTAFFVCSLPSFHLFFALNFLIMNFWRFKKKKKILRVLLFSELTYQRCCIFFLSIWMGLNIGRLWLLLAYSFFLLPVSYSINLANISCVWTSSTTVLQTENQLEGERRHSWKQRSFCYSQNTHFMYPCFHVYYFFHHSNKKNTEKSEKNQKFITSFNK